MVKIPILRWGQPYESLEQDSVNHFVTGETLAKVSQANPGLLAKDMKKAARARGVLREVPIRDLIQRMKKAGELYRDATLAMGDGQQSPDDFALQQSASTGLPEHMCKANMSKNHFVLSNMDRILDCLTRGLDLDILTRGYGMRESVSIYPGAGEMGAEVVSRVKRVKIFGSTETVQRYHGNPAVQVHGPGFSKILLGDDEVDNWEKYIDLMVDSVYLNSGRGCINCSGVWASRHTKEIAQALAERLGPMDVKPPEDPSATLAAFTVPGQAKAIHAGILEKCKEDGVTDMTAKFGPRLVEQERAAYLRPWVIHADAPERKIAQTEYMFPYVTVVQCSQAEMLDKIGQTLVCSAITNDKQWSQQLLEATHIDRLNIGPIPTIKLDWLQPHEGNIVDFLFRARAFQTTPERLNS